MALQSTAMLMVCLHYGNTCVLVFTGHTVYVAGAMRLPDKPDSPEKMHFLTDFYAKEEFGLKLLPFNNADDNAWLKFYDEDKIKIKGTFRIQRNNKIPKSC